MGSICKREITRSYLWAYYWLYGKNLLTNIFITRANQDLFIDSENVSAWEAISPAATRQIAQYHVLAVGFVFIRSCTIASIKANLLMKFI